MNNILSLEKLSEILKEKKWTLKDLAEKYDEKYPKENGGTSYNTLRKWNSGKGNPTLRMLVEVFDILDCDMDYLLGRLDEHTHTIANIKEQTGLSDISIENLITAQKGQDQNINKEQQLEYITKAVDYLLRYSPETLVNIGILLSPIKESGYITPQGDNPNKSLSRFINDQNLSNGFLVEINRDLQNLRDAIWNNTMPEEVILETKAPAPQNINDII